MKTKTVAGMLLLVALAGCETTGRHAVMGPAKIRTLNCRQLDRWRVKTEAATVTLFRSLRKRGAFGDREEADIVVLWPTLLFLKGPDSADGRNYTLLKEDYEAIREASATKSCGLVLRGDVSQAVVGDAKSPAARRINKVVDEETKR